MSTATRAGRTRWLRRVGTVVVAVFAVVVPLSSGPAIAAPAATDWSKAVVDSTMKRSTPAELGGWGYQTGLYLSGQYLVYKRTKDPKYLDYIRQWVDRFVDANGHLNHNLDSLDAMQAGNLLIDLYTETRQNRYKKAATEIRTRLDSYPRTSDGGFWHATGKKGQLWLDGTYMVTPFLIHYGQTFGDSGYARDEATKQLLTYGKHLADPSGLFFHAYDETGTQPWADPKTHHSPEFWCRSIGWYAMSTVDVLYDLPGNHPNRKPLLDNLWKLVQGISDAQDPKTGRWFQVPNKGSLARNWAETSCSAMFTYTVQRAVNFGLVDEHFRAVADRGYRGVLQKVSIGSDGLTNIADICIGTNVGDLDFYLDRPRKTNDPHGLGAFLIMNEAMRLPGT